MWKRSKSMQQQVAIMITMWIVLILVELQAVRSAQLRRDIKRRKQGTHTVVLVSGGEVLLMKRRGRRAIRGIWGRPE